MKKVVDFLERHVQWLAIALGAAFVLAMAWYYVITPPVTITIGKDVLEPSNIDKTIYDGPVTVLDAQLHGGGTAPALPKPDWMAQFKSAMEFSDSKPVTLSRPWVDSPVLPDVGNNGAHDIGIALAPIEKLPEVPPAKMGGTSMGSSSVVPPGSQLTPVDKNWLAISFLVPNKDEAAAFAAAKLPKALYPTAVLEVKLMREVQKQDGTWGNSVLIAKLPFDNPTPMPAAGAGEAAERAYLQWAEPNQKMILQPDFYTVAAGDPFVHPPLAVIKVEEKEPVAQGLPNFDPNRWQYSIEEWKQMTPEQSKLAHEALKKHEDEENKKKAGKGRPGGGGKSGGSTGPRGAHDIEDPDRPVDQAPDLVPNPYDPITVAMLVQNRQPDPDPQEPAGRGGAQAPFPAPTGTPAPGSPDAAGAPATQPSEYPVPLKGAYDPSVSPDNWVGWAIDDTVEPGKIYRYLVVYSIKNPVWTKPQNCKDPALAKIFAISSDVAKTGWSDPVKIPSRTSFYVARSLTERSSSVDFEVFAAQAGTKKTHTFTVSPGDMIGAPADGTDYSTGTTLVDLQTDPRTMKMYALVADASGAISRRDFDTDKASKDYAHDKAMSSGSAASVTTSPPLASGK